MGGLLVGSCVQFLCGCETWTLHADSQKKIQAFKTKCLRKFLCISYLEHKNNNWVQSKINSLVGPQEPLMLTVKRRKLCMSHTTTASPKSFFRVPWRVGNAMAGTGNARWTTSKSGHPCPSQECSQRPLAEKTGRGSLLNRPPCPPNNPISQGIELTCVQGLKRYYASHYRNNLSY